MVIELLTLLICFFLFLFTLYVLAREDFVFLRKNITVEDIFNVAFITAGFTLLFSRLFYAIFQFDTSFLNPFVFFLIPYFPGLSLVGAVIGGVMTVLVVTKKKKFPRGRFLDFFAYAFLSTLSVGYALSLLNGVEGSLVFAVLPILYYAFLFFFFMKILMPKFLQGQIKDGMLGLLILMNYSLFTSAVSIAKALHEHTAIVTPDVVILILIFLISLLFYLKQGSQLTLKRLK